MCFVSLFYFKLIINTFLGKKCQRKQKHPSSLQNLQSFPKRAIAKRYEHGTDYKVYDISVDSKVVRVAGFYPGGKIIWYFTEII